MPGTGRVVRPWVTRSRGRTPRASELLSHFLVFCERIAGPNEGMVDYFWFACDSGSICEERIISGLNAIVKKDGA
jgi:hypothetical protein